MKKELIKLGKIGKPHGLQGFFYLKAPITLFSGDTLFLGTSEKKSQKVTIKSLKEHKGKQIIQLSEFHDRTELEKHRGETLWAFPKAEEDPLQKFMNQEVCDINSKNFGIVSDFYNCGAGNIIIIRNDKGKSLELPFNEIYFNQEIPLCLLSCHSNFNDFWQD